MIRPPHLTARSVRAPRPHRGFRPWGAALLLGLAAMAGAWEAGKTLAGRIDLPRELAPEPGARFIPARDRDATALTAQRVPEGRARTLLGRSPHGFLLAVTMDYRHPDTGAPRRGTLYYETGWNLFRRIRPEMGGYAGPAFRAMAGALRAGGASRTAARLEAAPRYRLDGDVRLALPVERRLSQVADAYHDRAGHDLTVTSGTRNPEEQARAMYTKFVLGDDVVALYGGRPEVLEIQDAYKTGVASGKDGKAIQRAMADVIRAQVARGEYISNPLRSGAVDIRSRGLTKSQRAALEAAARAVPDVRLMEEKIPPHFHLQVTRR